MNSEKSVGKLKSIVFAFLVSITLQSIHTVSKAQITANNSPYSRYGIGDLSGKGFAQGFAMGGTNIAMQNDSTGMFFINSGNPASYSNIRLTTAELGVNISRLQLQSANNQQTINNASVGYLSLALPVKKWWGASVGLIPYSSVGYNVSAHQSINNVGDVDVLYQGSGGVNQVYFGNGIKPLYGLPKMFMKSERYQRLKQEKKDSTINRILKRKKSWQSLSLGVNASYMFGSINHEQTSIFPFNSNSFNTQTGTTTRIGDVYFDYGAQYAYTIDSLRGRDLKDNVQLLLGATFATKRNMNAKIDSLSYTYFDNSAGYQIVKDTIQNSQETKGKITFPLSFGFGLGFKKGDRWLVASDFAMQNWGSYTSFNQSQGLQNSMRISLGAQFIPNAKINGKGNYYKRIHYRIGARYAKTSIELQNTQLVENAVTFGLGFPVGRNFILQNFSMINIGLEIGQRGTISNGLIKEQFYKVTLGFTINDKWFVKPKFD
jgi:hypothetical protein